MASPRESRAPLRDDRETFKWRDARSPTAGSMPRPREPALHRRTHPPRVASPYARRPPFKKQGRAAGRESRAALPLVSPLHQGVRGGLSHRWGLCPATQPTPPNRAGARPATTLSPRRRHPAAATPSAAHPPAVIPAKAGTHGATPTTLSATRHHLPPPLPGAGRGPSWGLWPPPAAAALSEVGPRPPPGRASGGGSSAARPKIWPQRHPPPSTSSPHPPAVIPAQAGIHSATPTPPRASHHPLPRPNPAEAGAHPEVSPLHQRLRPYPRLAPGLRRGGPAVVDRPQPARKSRRSATRRHLQARPTHRPSSPRKRGSMAHTRDLQCQPPPSPPPLPGGGRGPS
jgi:hypothetical protein